jgi:LacI family transcriptional regulator
MTRQDGAPPGGAKRATLRQVAAEARVSAMTVSNFMRGRFGSMSEDTRARLEETVARLNYRPHSAGRGLRTAAGLSIGMIMVDESPTFLADPFITHIVAGLSNHLNQHGYGLVVEGLSYRDFRRSPLIRDLRTDAFCVMLSGKGPRRREILDTLMALRQPIVLFQERAPRSGSGVCVIRQDDRRGGELLARHLVERGARRIVFMAPELVWPAILERIEGARRAIAGHGAGLEVLPCGDGLFTTAEAAFSAHVQERGMPDAVMGGNDQLGIAALKVALRRGLGVPRDVMVTGFNAFEFWRYTEPVLTTVQSPAYEIGARGGAEIVQRLETGAFTRREIVFPVELRIGGSTRQI